MLSLFLFHFIFVLFFLLINLFPIQHNSNYYYYIKCLKKSLIFEINNFFFIHLKKNKIKKKKKKNSNDKGIYDIFHLKKVIEHNYKKK